MLYTEFFAVLSLVFYATENPEKPGSNEVLADARAGRQMIADLAEKSMSAERVTGALKVSKSCHNAVVNTNVYFQVLFDQLPENLERGVRPVPSKKRSASGRPGSVSSQHTPVPTTISSIRTDDLARRGSQMTSSTFRTPMTRSSIDTMHAASSHGFPDGSMTTSLSDYMSIDLQRATPDSTASTGTSSQRNPYQGPSFNSHNPVHKLDTLMFPSEDPFAYPNQPMMELGLPMKTDPPVSMGGQTQEPQFFLTGSFDDVDSQIFGNPPPYMMHQGQPMMNLASQMYDANSIMGMQASHPLAHPQVQVPTPQQHHGHPLAHRRAHAQRHQERQIQQMFTNQGMQADWGSFFGSGRGGFQGM